jgi:alkylated DNA repair protein alkB family protein 1
MLIFRIEQWGTKSYLYDLPARPIPPAIYAVCRDLVRQLPWCELGEEAGQTWNESYEPEAGVVNFYTVRVVPFLLRSRILIVRTLQPKDSLTAHVDASEVATVAPLVSLS